MNPSPHTNPYSGDIIIIVWISLKIIIIMSKNKQKEEDYTKLLTFNIREA